MALRIAEALYLMVIKLSAYHGIIIMAALHFVVNENRKVYQVIIKKTTHPISFDGMGFCGLSDSLYLCSQIAKGCHRV